jgi:4-hydroxy-3-polyprenylbenzoate decarboxylase
MGLPLELTGPEVTKIYMDKLNEPMELVPPMEVKKGPVMQNIYHGDDVNLFMFPAPKFLAGDGGRYIGTGDTVITRDPDEGWVNVGVHRIQIHDKNTATIFHEPGKDGDIIRRKYWSKGQSCPVAVTLGGDLDYFSAAATHLPWGMSEYDYMGWWRKKPAEVIKGPVTGLPIPADAEIVLEGEMVPPEVESRMEGPFSEWTGHYSHPRPESAFKVKCILHRDNPIILAALAFFGTWAFRPRQDLRLWNHLTKLVPGVKGVWELPHFGGHHAVAISIEQKYGGHAKEAALAALGFYNYTRKFIIVVDDDIDPSDINEVLFAVGMRSNPESWDIIRDCWDGTLDPLLSPQKREIGDITQSAVIILACKPYHWIKDFPPRVKSSPELEERVKEKWPDLLQ